METKVGQDKIRLAAFNGPSPKTPYKRKNRADVFYTNRVIAHFVLTVVAMATTLLNWLTPKIMPRTKKYDSILYTAVVTVMPV